MSYFDYKKKCFFNVIDRRKKAKIPELRNPGVFFVRCKRTYVLNNQKNN